MDWTCSNHEKCMQKFGCKAVERAARRRAASGFQESQASRRRFRSTESLLCNDPGTMVRFRADQDLLQSPPSLICSVYRWAIHQGLERLGREAENVCHYFLDVAVPLLTVVTSATASASFRLRFSP
jgi:hypothetical protein